VSIISENQVLPGFEVGQTWRYEPSNKHGWWAEWKLTKTGQGPFQRPLEGELVGQEWPGIQYKIGDVAPLVITQPEWTLVGGAR
jgi:hypothetical protein